METEDLRLSTRILTVFGVLVIAGYVAFRNYPVFGLTINLEEKQISDLSPGTRVEKVLTSLSEVRKQKEDLIYFTTQSEGFDNATVRITFLSTDTNQEIHLGFKDRADWHYKSKPMYLPLIEKLSWYKGETEEPFFYQKNKKYSSFSEFIKAPKESEVVGSYYLENDFARDKLEGYVPSGVTTKINTPLRGTHSFYTYIENEPFSIKVEKQDLNWYSGLDTLKIRVTKDGEILSEKDISDDGIAGVSQEVKDPQSEEIKYEGGFPESGLYKIDLIASGDSVIKSIETSFPLISFKGPIYPISGSSVYNPQIATGSANILYTDASSLNFKTQHGGGKQEIKINSEKLKIEESEIIYAYKNDKTRNIIEIPKGDVIVDGAGFFSFDKSQFFMPFLFNKREVKNETDLEQIDFLLTDYAKPFNADEGWKESEIKFDLKKAHHDKGKLSWIIRAPGLKERGESILIKGIEVTLTKEPLFQ